jgi:hypothetical protein
MIQIRIGEQDTFETGSTNQVGCGQQGNEGFYLNPNIWRGIEQKPATTIWTDGNTRLGSGESLQSPRANAAAVAAVAIPLGEPAACCSSQQPHPHWLSLTYLSTRRDQATTTRQAGPPLEKTWGFKNSRSRLSDKQKGAPSTKTKARPLRNDFQLTKFNQRALA